MPIFEVGDWKKRKKLLVVQVLDICAINSTYNVFNAVIYKDKSFLDAEVNIAWSIFLFAIEVDW